MISTFSIQDGLNKSHLGENEPLNKIIRGSIKRKGRTGVPFTSSLELPWNDALFFLNNSRLYQNLNKQNQLAILSNCNNFILSESYFIEKSGLAYCAKMILAGETTEIRQMYGLIASDESVHLQWLSPYVPDNLRTIPQGKFIYMISEMIEQCDVNTLYYLVQTILEGWGITYYRTLASTCQRNDLKQTLSDIVKDEAIHHQTGVALFDFSKLNKGSMTQLIEGMKSYCEVLRIGAQNIVKCIEACVGELSTKELSDLFEDLQTYMSSKLKLGVLKAVMAQPDMAPMIQQLENEGYFIPYSAEKCALIYSQNR